MKLKIFILISSACSSNSSPTPLPFATEEITGCTIEAAKGANKAPINLPSFLFHVLLFQ